MGLKTNVLMKLCKSGSFVDYLARTRASKFPLREANVFVSYAQSYLWLEVREALLTHADAHGKVLPPDCYVWMDIFCVDQHVAKDIKTESWMTLFENVVRKMDRVVAVMTPWEAPVAVRRSWCCFELLASFEHNLKDVYEVCVPPSERARATAAMRKGMLSLAAAERMIGEVDVLNAKATLEEEEIKIRKRIIEMHVPALNRAVVRPLTEWIMKQALDAAGACRGAEAGHSRLAIGTLVFARGKWNNALEHTLAAEELFNGDVLDPSRELNIATARDTLAMIYIRLHAIDKAEEMAKSALEIRQRLLGDFHVDSFASRFKLAQVACFKSSGSDLDWAKRLLLEIVDHSRITLGPRHPDTLHAVSDLAWVLCKLGEVDVGWSMEKDVYEMRRDTLGESHPQTLVSVFYYSCCCVLAGGEHRVARGMEVAGQAVAVARNVWGDSHPFVAGLLACRVLGLVSIGRDAEAETALGAVLEVWDDAVENYGCQVADECMRLSDVGMVAQACMALNRDELAKRLMEEHVERLASSRTAFIASREDGNLVQNVLERKTYLLRALAHAISARENSQEAVRARARGWISNFTLGV